MTRLRGAALVNVLAHALGLACAALFLKPGTPLVSVEDRVGWLATRPWQWPVGWAVWIWCALAMGGFVTVLGRALRGGGGRGSGGLAGIAIVAAWVAVAIDVACDAAWMTMPARAVEAARLGDAGRFLDVERALGAVGQVGANGLYSLAVLLLSASLPGRVARWLGVATFVAGMGIVAAGVADDARLLMWSTGPTIGLFCAWTAVSALVVERAGARAAAARAEATARDEGRSEGA